MADAAQVQREMFEVVKAKDFEGLRALYGPDYTYTGADGVEGGADAGVAVAETYLSAFPDVEFEIRHQHSPSDSVAIMEFTARGTHTGDLEGIAPTGKRIEIIVCNVVETRDGKVVREREYFDTLAMMRQLGVMGDG
jgi:steroid delta-isomerase-like uncharacterized protein